MCYSLESSIRTSVLSLASCIYLYTSGIAKFKWLSVTLLGWSVAICRSHFMVYLNLIKNAIYLKQNNYINFNPIYTYFTINWYSFRKFLRNTLEYSFK